MSTTTTDRTWFPRREFAPPGSEDPLQDTWGIETPPERRPPLNVTQFGMAYAPPPVRGPRPPRSYGDLLLNRASRHPDEIDIYRVPTRRTEIEIGPDDLVFTTQRSVSESGVQRYEQQLASGRPVGHPEIVRGRSGRLWVQDGHHRLAAARRRGQAITAEVYEPLD